MPKTLICNYILDHATYRWLIFSYFRKYYHSHCSWLLRILRKCSSCRETIMTPVRLILHAPLVYLMRKQNLHVSLFTVHSAFFNSHLNGNFEPSSTWEHSQTEYEYYNVYNTTEYKVIIHYVNHLTNTILL